MRAWFRGRYGRTFMPEDVSLAYKEIFAYQKAKEHILPDLAEFCKVSEPAPRVPDMFAQGRAAGHRDVFLHIQEMCHLSNEEVRAYYISKAKEV